MALVAFSLIPTILIALFVSVLFNARTERLIEDNIRSSAQLQAETIKGFFVSSHENLRTIEALIKPDELLTYYERYNSASNSVLSDLYKLKDHLDNAKTSARSILKNYSTQQNTINRISIVNTENKVIVSSNVTVEGKTSKVDDRQMEQLAQGQFTVSNLFKDTYQNDAPSFMVSIPVIKNDVYLGFITMSCNTAQLDTLVHNAKFYESGTVHVLDSENNFVSSNISSMESMEQRSLIEKITSYTEQSGVFKFKYIRSSKTVCFFKIPSVNWTVLCTVGKEEISVKAGGVILAILVAIAMFMLIVAILRKLLMKYITMPLEKLITYLHQMNKGDYESRIPFLGKNEFSEIATAFNNLMVKIQEDNRELSIKEERYRIANEQSNSIIIEYNVETGSLTCSPNACEFAAYPSFTKGFPESLIEHDVVSEQDAEQFVRLVHGMMHGRRHGAMEIRMRTYRDEHHWFNMSLTTITDLKTFKPLRIIGKLTDIDSEKRNTASLTFKAERDPLTSIYNKAATQTLISQRISERKQDYYYAFMVMDIDCFKNVNDGYGHQKGDTVLVEVATALVSQIRGDDVVGRIGGDEFMLMLTHMPSKEAVANKAENLLAAVRKIQLDESKGTCITCSMGIALCPQDGISFNQLYAKADNALYSRKNAGKNGFSFYCDPIE